ncbi:MAG: PKD domain-containing protein [Flavobacteriales bacterium]|nr:PKD domain-containing protein [Flavobacteriales bacterium]
MTFMVTVSDGCSKVAIESVTVNIFPSPTIGIKAVPQPVCPGKEVTLTDTINSISGSIHDWNFGDGQTATGLTVQHTYLSGGAFYPTLTVTSPKGCARTFNATVPIVMYAKPNAYFEPSRFEADLNNTSINFTNLSSITPVSGDVIESYLWNFGDGQTDTDLNTEHTFDGLGTYTVSLTVTSNFGCVSVFTEEIIIVVPFIDLLIPTAFTPDPTSSSGGIYDPNSFDNDVFYPITTYVQEYSLQIYNRWGELIFESTSYPIGWDGYYRETLAQQDTYIWKLSIVWISGQEYNEVGRILLIR